MKVNKKYCKREKEVLNDDRYLKKLYENNKIKLKTNLIKYTAKSKLISLLNCLINVILFIPTFHEQSIKIYTKNLEINTNYKIYYYYYANFPSRIYLCDRRIYSIDSLESDSNEYYTTSSYYIYS